MDPIEHILERVGWADDLDGEVRNDLPAVFPRNRLVKRPTTGRDKRDIRPTTEQGGSSQRKEHFGNDNPRAVVVNVTRELAVDS